MVDQKKSIKIVIAPDGTVTMDVQGAMGSQCTEMTAPFEAALGNNVKEREFKDEYYATDESLELNKEKK
jgi:hypothetical protein